MGRAPLLRVLPLLSDRGGLAAWRGQKKRMVDHSGETGLRSGTESQSGTGTGTGTESGTEVSEVEGVHLATEGGVEAGTEWKGGTDPEDGKKMEQVNVGEGGRGTAIGTETEIGRETAIETETDATGGTRGTVWRATGSGGGATMGIGTEGGQREENGER